jgi:hypothetical protein
MSPRDSNRSESVYQDTSPTTIIEKFDAALDVLAAAVMDGCPDPACLTRGMQKENLRKTNR